MKICDIPRLSNSISNIFPTVFPHFMSLCHILVILTFQTSLLLLYLLWWFSSHQSPTRGLVEAIGVKTFFHYSFFNWDNSVLFPIMTAQIYIPTKSVPGFSFLHILNNICYLWYVWWQPFGQAWGDISLWFWFVFPLYLVVLSIFW